MGINGAEEAGGFERCAAECGFTKESLEGKCGNFAEWLDATSGIRDSGLPGWEGETIVELGWGNEELGNFPVVIGANEGFANRWGEGNVEDGVGECGIGGVAVVFPVGGCGVDLDVSDEVSSFDFDGAVCEVRALAMVPFAELADCDVASVSESEVSSEGTGEPKGLEFQFWWKFGSSDFLKAEGRMPDAFEEVTVVHFCGVRMMLIHSSRAVFSDDEEYCDMELRRIFTAFSFLFWDRSMAARCRSWRILSLLSV